MGWGKGESIIEQRREQIGSDPKATIRALQEDLRREDLKPRERVRILGMVAACYKHTGERLLAKEYLAEARAIPKAGKIAILEIVAQETDALIEWALQGKESWDSALASSVVFVQETLKLPRRKPTTAWGRRQERNRCRLRVGALMARGQVAFYTGEVDTAIEYGYRALGELPSNPKSGPTPKVSEKLTMCAISLIANALVRGGSGVALEDGIVLVKDVIASLPSTEKVSRSCLSALLGCAEVRRGNFDEAVQIFESALDMLTLVDASSSYSYVMKLWEWSVKNIVDQRRHIQEYLARQRVKLPLK